MGAALVLMALATMPFHLLALLGPVGTKLVDDDPFGLTRLVVIGRRIVVERVDGEIGLSTRFARRR